MTDQSNGFEAASALLRDAFEVSGLSQARLADLVGTSKREINAYLRCNFEACPGHPTRELLGRIARQLELDERSIVEKAGWKFSRKVSDRGLVKTLRGKYASDGIVQLSSTALNGRILTDIRNRPGERIAIRAAVVKEMAHPETKRFDKDFATLICSLINHRWEIKEDECTNEEEEIDHLWGRGGSCDMILGVLESLDRVAQSLCWVRYPGIRNSIDALRLRPKPLSWSQVRKNPGVVNAVTTRGDVGDAFMRSICSGYDDDSNLHAIPEQTVVAIAKKLRELWKGASGEHVIFCGAENLCETLLKSNLDFPLHRVTRTDDDIALPVLDAGIAVLHDVEWVSLLEKAVEQAFRMAPDRMAVIYTNLFMSLIPRDRPVDHGLTFARLHPLGIADTSEFLLRMFDELKERLMQAGLPDPHTAAAYCVELAFRASNLKIPREPKKGKASAGGARRNRGGPKRS